MNGLAWRLLLTGSLLLAALSATVRDVRAQVDPRGALRTIHTPHFRVHFGRGLDSLAQRAAVQAEQAYAVMARELAPPRGTIDLLVADNVDASNGFAQVFPSNRIVVYAVPPLQLRELRYHDDWLRLVITHELAHVFHLDRSRGVYRIGRALFGRNPIVFPNAMLPSWVKEGLAIHYESALTGSGRRVSAEFEAQARAAAIDTIIPPMGRWSLAASRFPRGQTAYAWGAMTLDRALTRDSAMRRFVDGTAAKLPLIRLTSVSRRALGVSLGDEAAAHRDELMRAVPHEDAAGDSAWRIVSRDGFYASAPRWIGADRVGWSASNGREIPGWYVAARSPGGGEFEAPRRVAWRNSLDANTPIGEESVMGFRQRYSLRRSAPTRT